MGPRCWKSLFFICFQMAPEDGFQMAFPARPVLAGVRFWHHRGRRCRNCWQGHGSGATEAGNAGRGTVLGPAWPQTLAGARSWGYGFAHTQTCRQVLLNKTQVFPICLWKRMFAYEHARLQLRAQLPVQVKNIQKISILLDFT